MTWLGNGYTVADYDGSSRTTYLDTRVIDFPPIPQADEDEEHSKLKATNGMKINRINGSLQGSIVEKVDLAILPATTAA